MDPSLEDLRYAVEYLTRTERGRNALKRLLAWLDDDGLGMDAYNQRAAMTVLESAWGPWSGTARDLMREEAIPSTPNEAVADEKTRELRIAVHQLEKVFYDPKEKKQLSDLRPAFWHALGSVVLSAALVDSPESDAVEITRAIGKARKQLGAPGDFGYGTPCGDALRNLYDRHNEVCRLLINQKDKEAAHG